MTRDRSGSFHLQSPTAVTEVFGGLSGFGHDEVYEPPKRHVERNLSGDMMKAAQSLVYSEADLELLTQDTRQFEVLKASLRKKGAVTNEILKQKLPLYLKYKKDRLAKTHPEVVEALRRMPARTRSGGRVERMEQESFVKPVNRVLSNKEKGEDTSVLGRIMRPSARRGTPKRASSLGRVTPGRNNSFGQQVLEDVQDALSVSLGPRRSTPLRHNSFGKQLMEDMQDVLNVSRHR